MTEGGSDVVLAAGAVVWRKRDGRVEVAVVHRPRYDDWSLPKGKLDPGEHVLSAALREVAEETGHEVVLGRPLGATSYVALGRPKRVHYWAAQALGGEFSPHDEIDALEWQPPEVAREQVHRDADRAVLDEFVRVPLHTVPLIVLRHAKAMSRKAWGRDDEDRPLSTEGEEQAARLPAVLAAWRPEVLVSSPARRCVQTLEPLLDGTPVDTEDGLSEPGHEADPEVADKVVARLASAGRPGLVCSHRPVLPPLLDAVRDRSEVRIDLGLSTTPLRPAELVVAHLAGGRVVAAERHRP